MSDREALIRTICVDPFDDAPRLALADHLDEAGDPMWSEFIRFQIRAYTLKHDHRPVAESGGCEKCALGRRVRIRRFRELMKRLWTDFATCWLPDKFPIPDDAKQAWGMGQANGRIIAELRSGASLERGLVGRLVCTHETFMRHAGKLFAYAPIINVSLTDRVPATSGGNVGGYQWYESSANWRVTSNRSILPAALFGHLPRAPVRPITYAEAFAALSLACVRYGRKLAGLPPLAEPFVSTLLLKT